MPDTAAPTPPALVRRLGTIGVLLLTLSVTTPASSLFVIVPGMLQVAGTGAIWATIAAGLVCVATAYIYAELGSAWPSAGGEYVMAANMLGPAAGFVMLGINVFNNVLFIPVAALGIADVLGNVIPGLPAIPLAIGVIAACTLVAVLDIRVNALVTGIFLAIEVVTLAVVAACGLVATQRSPLDFLTHPVAAGSVGMAPAPLASIGVAASIAIFAFNGYGVAIYFGEEMHEAPTRIARAIMLAVVATLVLEGVPLLAALLGAADLPALLRSPDPFGDLVAQIAGPRVAGAVALGVALAIVNALIAWVLACARFFYGTGRDRSWGRPLDRWMTAIHPRFGSPWIGTLLVGAAGATFCFLPQRLLAVWSGAGLIAIYAGIALAAMVGRHRESSSHTRYRMPLHPLAPIATLAALALIVWTMWFDPVDGRPALLATLAQIVLALGYFQLVLRRRGWHAT